MTTETGRSAETDAVHRRPYSAVHEQTIPFLRRTRRHADRSFEHPQRNSAGICGSCGDGAVPLWRGHLATILPVARVAADQVLRPGPEGQ